MKPEEQDPLNPRRYEPGYGCEPYFAATPSIPSRPQELRLKLPDVTITLKTDRGVFSYTHVDRGTLVLLREDLPPKVPGDLLDLGCGYGLVAITLALRYPNRRVWGIDVNERAVDLLNENAARLNLANVQGVTPEQAKGNMFAAIYSNPPVRVGKQAMRELLIEWLQRL
ncbi:MAG: methyltransferase, partial [Ktedonobacteraceae bacterium]|nr:methyltransferase [Ktedonobacteraceae bacterium]